MRREHYTTATAMTANYADSSVENEQDPSASEMTYIVSGGALNSILTQFV